MGILDSMAQQAQPQVQQAPAEQGGGMQQMYQFLMDNSMRAIADIAAQRIQEKGPVEGVADLIATAMVSNLQAARQNGKTIPPQVMLQVAKDIGMNLLQQMGVPEEELDDVFIDVILRALELFGDMSDGMIPPEEEQQYVEMIQRIAQAEQQRQSQMSGNAPQEQMGGM
ncbi:TPA: hypothetical protein ACY37E_001410 [Pasteurella multocida]|uniref:hypothetical protein n=1 Tax=Pasteurella multocida TaxID=747 RepID=UPI000F70F291|nr:hypothetical protein [Pasteurella multocida]VEJ15755.1 Uncharacterised protein [Pasteurella multocida subsp. septica]HDR1050716.1 hypothetical protein [Pasteurella multocida]HDR1217994.1 hypothetical protein [Pasteurella multocida]HDR1857061.1 hypothetical protein [Pasteurella multocida]HEA3246485.1 hypothetical protein [Pasteurella multocida]